MIAGSYGPSDRDDARLVDRDVRDRIVTALDRTLIVEAAAGTGKTTALVRRMLQVLATGHATVSRLVAVTFTEKAAGELKLRLRQELESGRHDPALDATARGRLEDALRTLEEARIGTIHGFCADLLRERPIEAGIDPLFTVLTDAQARRLYDEAFTGWLHAALEDPPSGVRRSLRRSSRGPATGDADGEGPVDRLRAAGWALAEWRDFPAGWTRPVFDRAASIETLVGDVHAFATLTARAGSASDGLFVDTAAGRRASADLRLVSGADGIDLDAAEAMLVDLSRDRDFARARLGSGRFYGPGLPRAEVHAAHDALVPRLEAFRADADADLAALLRDELRASLEAYARLKAAQGALDFLDLLLCARNLVRDCDAVRAALQTACACLFVDEFQDTDPLQAELLLLLAADDPRQRDWTSVRARPGALFIVGDPKQSIYRFRRADVGVYRQVCDQLFATGAERLQLTTSFRSVPNLQRAINAAFAPAMTGNRDTLQADYVPLAPARSESRDQPSLVALPVPAPYGRRYVSAAAIEGSLPAAVGAFVEWLVTRSGWMVTERRGGVPVPVQARHVCLLFRRFVHYGADMARPYIDALEARGLPHLLVGGRAFHGREEIETLRAALAAIEWPDDELSVFATLRGACFAIGDEDLLEYRHRWAPAFHPFRVPPSLPDHLQPIGEALALLADLHRARNHRTVADTVVRLLDATRAHVGFALRRAGEQVLANVLHVAELARQYELGGGLSFRGFVDEMRDAAEDAPAAEAPIVEEGSDGVRLMTVHKAKGLEFPVVVLADLTARMAPLDASRHIDPAAGLCALRIGGWSPLELRQQQAIEQAREREEGIRIAYVAATRARDLLVVPAVGDTPYDAGWVSPLHEAIYPPPDRRRQAAPAPNCPAFRTDSVLTRPGDEIASPATVSPGLHTLTANTAGTPGWALRDAQPFDVIWWDPATLMLEVEPPFGLRREELIARDVEPEIVAAGQRGYVEWREARAAALAQGRIASMRVTTATEWARQRARHTDRPPGANRTPDGPPGATRVEIVSMDAVGDRPAGPRFGTLVHAALAIVRLDADAGTIATVVATQGRIVAASAGELSAATDVVGAALTHPVFERARAAWRQGRCLREVPVSLMEGGVLVEGIVDLAFDEGGEMVVVDFKTDRPDPAVRAQYEQQVALYAEAVASATGRPARALLFMI